MRRLVPIALGAALAMAALPAAAAPPPHANGGVTALVGNATVKFEFNAHGNGQKGHVNWRNETTGLWFKGDVNCYLQVGNTAYFSGVVTETGSPAFTHFLARVEDNGEGPDATADRFRVSPGSFRGNCPTGPADWWTASDGNLQVHQ